MPSTGWLTATIHVAVSHGRVDHFLVLDGRSSHRDTSMTQQVAQAHLTQTVTGERSSAGLHCNVTAALQVCLSDAQA
jgi:hypothetical protein